MTKLSGSAVIVTLVAVALLLTFVLGAVRVFPRDVLVSRHQSEQRVARHAAWAGIEHGLLLIKHQRKEPGDSFSPASLDVAYDFAAMKDNCALEAESCFAFNRLLGKKKTITPLTISLDSQTQYSLTLGHKTSQLGNAQDMADGWNKSAISTTHAGNRNPVFRHNVPYSFRASGLTSDVLLRASIVPHEKCRDAATATMAAVWKDAAGKKLAETTGKVNRGEEFSDVMIPFPGQSVNPESLVVTFMFTKNVPECFGRFALVPSKNDVIDFGFDVLESTGKRNSTSFTVRMLVGRQGGHVLGLYEGFSSN